ncbi:MAG: hypothetical protein K8R69_09985 [Deltaproteobacteria bacterium]|nr:hypothetical protein [Deltaproteobacteria bacterium]
MPRFPWTSSFLALFLLLSCSGGAGLGGGGGGPVGPQADVGQHAAPGMEEVAVGPGKSDYGGENDAVMRCENIVPDETKPSQLSARVHVLLDAQPASDRLVRIIEHHLHRYRQVKADASGTFDFSFENVPDRNIVFILLTSGGEEIPLNTILPCPDDSCVDFESGNLKIKIIAPYDASCVAIDSHPPIKNIPVPASGDSENRAPIKRKILIFDKD